MSHQKIDQKEYLKKYLSGGSSHIKKKKKKKEKSASNVRLNIVDDDIDLSQLANATEEDLDNYNLGEDLPQIAGIIDERPAELIAKEDYKKSAKWKTLGNDDNDNGTEKVSTKPETQKSDEYTFGIKSKRVRNRSPPRSNRTPDVSPPRRSNRSHDSSPRRRKSPPKRSDRSPDASPPRRSNKNHDLSPRRRKSPPKRSDRSPDASPPRRFNRSPDSRHSERKPNIKRKMSDSPPPTHKKMSKTLEGKIAGLQDAKALREENEQFKRREDEMYRRMEDKRKNYDDGTVIGDRKTGRRRHLRENVEKEREKQKKHEERKQVYDKWGKGLKQLEEYKARVETETHEMSKPVARYANDADLEDYLKTQYRDGDPMAAYMRKKTNESQKGPCKPIYQGSFPENRFSIRPGYRWDGVDRSNGYEKKWFDKLSQKKAGEEEAYKYSVEDM